MRKIKYGNPLLIDWILRNKDIQNNLNDTWKMILEMYETVPKLYEDVEQTIKNGKIDD